MKPPKKKRSTKKARSRNKTGSFNLIRVLSYTIFLLLLVFSVCAVGYVIFFRTVVAQEIPPALRGDIVFEEPDPPVHKDDLAEKSGGDRGEEVVKEKPAKKKAELPMVAIIIDDLGYDEDLWEELLKFPIELTYSFLPFAPYTRKLERLTYRAGKTVFLHLPLEPKNSKFNPGPGALYLQDSPEMLREKLAKCLQEVPHAMGVNNHMGSTFTEDRPAMTNIIHELKERSLMFVDSFTTSGSVGLKVARQAAVKSIGRSVFLDNVLDEEKICDRLEQLVIQSEKNGRAVGIGHPHRETVNAVLRCGEKYMNRVQYVGVRDVL
ncbi:MAG: divergent polysaccharide deacetylase family protein [Pseudomonadota bacterium]